MLGVRAAASAADDAVTTLYAAHYRDLVRLAALLAGDAGTGERIVQDSFAALHGAWPRLGGADGALAYLRRSVVSRSRPARRRPPGGGPAADEHDAVLAIIAALPARQREALILRFYLELPDEQIDEAMGLRPGAAAGYADQGMAALRALL
jgi:DNA-directed RNA polymerase specialized sigma24 family protein